MIRKQTALWKIQSGDKIRICDMSDTHLLNALRMLERYAQNELDNATLQTIAAESQFSDGSMAQASCEAESMRLTMANPVGEFLPDIYHKMELDAERRGLELNG